MGEVLGPGLVGVVGRARVVGGRVVRRGLGGHVQVISRAACVVLMS